VKQNNPANVGCVMHAGKPQGFLVYG